MYGIIISLLIDYTLLAVLYRASKNIKYRSPTLEGGGLAVNTSNQFITICTTFEVQNLPNLSLRAGCTYIHWQL